MVDHPVVEILTTKSRAISGCLDLDNTFFDHKKRLIERSSSKIEDQGITFTFDLLVETVGDGSGGGFLQLC